MTRQLLLVDDDALLRRSLAYTLTQAGYGVQAAASAEEAFLLLQKDPPDLILLDIGLPGMDGLEALRKFQAACDAPVIFLTARRRNLDEVLGLELGAEDYIVKPFDPDVLVARIRGALRRREKAVSQRASASVLDVGQVSIDLQTRTVTRAGEPVDLPPRAFDLLAALAARPGQVVSIEQLLDEVWGPQFRGEPQVVYVHIRWLRERLEIDPKRPQHVITIHGVGYKLV